MCNVSLFAECVSSIREYDKEDENEMLEAKYLKIRGCYSYTLPCGGIVTSVEARGFCGRPNDVELRLLTGKRANLGLMISFDDIYTAGRKMQRNCYCPKRVNFHVPRGYALVADFNLTAKKSATLSQQ